MTSEHTRTMKLYLVKIINKKKATMTGTVLVVLSSKLNLYISVCVNGSVDNNVSRNEYVT